ncbi:Predicted N-acetyltransferase YhbS [Fontibacillus panacisegetis]|uniref:Predicted N-acetyltransferase YhbS n=1 Tax=Fontibacillus panacisegetis TaxID=670482 RepID=A0A1G7KRD5_9BACL|nr:GNAT family N-acetyltransferase [Fontibacillus panacisegetis]SDF39666.1 Predicted N-acetyltransferase YhbS [Fontibacillus panacisegetis]
MITIRQITRDDLKDLSQLYDDLIDKKTNYKKLVEVFETIKSNDNYYILGAFKDSELVGSVMGIICQDIVGECRPFMVIENVIVSNHIRRQGIGKKLMAKIEIIARDRNCYYIIFVSGGQRKEAHAFYEKLGFKDEKVEGYRKHFFED